MPEQRPEIAEALGMDPTTLSSIEYGVLSCVPKISQEDIYSGNFVVKAGIRFLHCLVLRGDMLLMDERPGGPQSFVFAACPELKIDPY